MLNLNEIMRKKAESDFVDIFIGFRIEDSHSFLHNDHHSVRALPFILYSPSNSLSLCCISFPSFFAFHQKQFLMSHWTSMNICFWHLSNVFFHLLYFVCISSVCLLLQKKILLKPHHSTTVVWYSIGFWSSNLKASTNIQDVCLVFICS